jgi:hypothetical protein
VHRRNVAVSWDGSFYATNSHGWRGPEREPTFAPDELRIAAIGDSCTFGKGVEEEATWPRRLERQLQAKDAERSARLANAMTEVQAVFAGDTRDPDGKPLTTAGRIAMAERVLTQRYRAEPWLVAGLMADLSGRYYEAGDLHAQRSMLGRARAVALEANAFRELALADCLRAINYWLEDILDSARTDVNEAKAALARDRRPDRDVVAICLEAEGKLLQATGSPDSGIALIKRAVRALYRGRDDGGNRFCVFQDPAYIYTPD